MPQNEAFVPYLSTIDAQLFLIEGDRPQNLSERVEARHRDWEYAYWQKTGHSPIGSRHYRRDRPL